VAIEDHGAFEVWQRLKPDTEFAVSELRAALEDPEMTPAATLDAYLFAKRALAESMQSLMRSQLPASSRAAFQEIRTRIQDELHSRFAGRVPDRYLRVPYGTKANEELFAVLHQEIGSPVDSARLRTINADDIHTERRIRELRELGLDVIPSKVNGNQYYVLGSLDLDSDRIRELPVKAIRNTKSLSKAEKEDLIARIS
jgi:hypothetical protein